MMEVEFEIWPSSK